jgi:23S rRNA (adenine(2503)-C(2))-methyltransferase
MTDSSVVLNQGAASSQNKKRVLSPHPIFDSDALLAYFSEKGFAAKHAHRMVRTLIRSKDCASVLDVPDLPKACYAELPSRFAVTTSKLVEARTSADKSTTKLLIELQDKQLVEAVIMRHDVHSTLCVSSQVGCQMGCTFCATGTMGLRGNLNAGEILEQLYYACRIEPIRNVVFMGMGEPLANYEQVLGAVRAMTDPDRFGLSKNKVTLSTVGIAPRMEQLAREAPFVNLAFSLHAPTQEMRLGIVPAARAWPLPRLLAALEFHIATCERSVLVQYAMMGGVNDSDDTAHACGALLRGRQVILNLIPYNPTDVIIVYTRPSEARVAAFQAIVQTYKVHVTVRKEMGADVGGACGQLVVSKGQGGGGGCSSGGGGGGGCSSSSSGGGGGGEGGEGGEGTAGVDDIEELFRVGKQRSRAKQEGALKKGSAARAAGKKKHRQQQQQQQQQQQLKGGGGKAAAGSWVSAAAVAAVLLAAVAAAWANQGVAPAWAQQLRHALTAALPQ